MTTPLILVTNDDGINSPGLAAAAAALDSLGEVLIVAPAVQQTSMGRSRSRSNNLNGTVTPQTVTYQNKTWKGYAVNATPALTVEHAIYEIAPRPIDLVISGINYGENVGTCITVSGTIGAAMEAAERGLKALAVSLETDVNQYIDHDETMDFSIAAYFTRLFSERSIEREWPFDVDVLKIEVPVSATKESPWMVTKQDRISYYTPKIRKRDNTQSEPTKFEYLVAKGQYTQENTDAYALAQGIVSVTPLSLDHTSRVDLLDVNKLIE